MTLKREDIVQGRIEAWMIEAERQGLFRRMPPAKRADSRRKALAAFRADEPIRLFGYGSLMWNPCIHYQDRRPGLVRGYHRSFCLWTPLGRGTPDCPGLTLALEPGGSCHGIVYRIDPKIADRELEIVWNREMITGAYRPRLLRVETADGPVRAIAFVANRDHERYACKLPVEKVADAVADAEGGLGRCADYLFNTVDHLDELGIADGTMHRLRALVERRLAARQETVHDRQDR